MASEIAQGAIRGIVRQLRPLYRNGGRYLPHSQLIQFLQRRYGILVKGFTAEGRRREYGEVPRRDELGYAMGRSIHYRADAEPFQTTLIILHEWYHLLYRSHERDTTARLNDAYDRIRSGPTYLKTRGLQKLEKQAAEREANRFARSVAVPQEPFMRDVRVYTPLQCSHLYRVPMWDIVRRVTETHEYGLGAACFNADDWGEDPMFAVTPGLSNELRSLIGSFRWEIASVDRLVQKLEATWHETVPYWYCWGRTCCPANCCVPYIVDFLLILVTKVFILWR